ncbi:MAG TPA: phytoene/squalene synthase family protein [Ignavibacteria bacterium]|nr:phytoene/squalene synthase family protein [Ignavibacteria bacterium]
MINTSPLFYNYDQCKAYTRRWAKSFYFSSFLLPKEKRNAAYAVYTFCRYTDNLVDNSHDGGNIDMNVNSRFAHVYNYLDDVYSVANNHNYAFADTIEKFKIPKHYFTDLIDGVTMDITKKRYATFMELDSYCYKVASVVGLMMSEIFGYSSKSALPYAIYLGKAMQLTNILRDVYEDYLMERIYLPHDERKFFGYTEEDIGKKVTDGRFTDMMRFNVERNRAFYELAKHGIPYLTNDGSRTTAVLMYKIYSGILHEIEKYDYDIYSSRRYVSTVGKLRMTGSYFINLRERKRFASLPTEKHHERIRTFIPEMNFDV